jgi:hypothetical protein
MVGRVATTFKSQLIDLYENKIHKFRGCPIDAPPGQVAVSGHTWKRRQRRGAPEFSRIYSKQWADFADIETIQSQLAKPQPNISILKAA